MEYYEHKKLIYNPNIYGFVSNIFEWISIFLMIFFKAILSFIPRLLTSSAIKRAMEAVQQYVFEVCEDLGAHLGDESRKVHVGWAAGAAQPARHARPQMRVSQHGFSFAKDHALDDPPRRIVKVYPG